MTPTLVLVAVWLNPSGVAAQSDATLDRREIAIDGRLDDPGWKGALVWTTGDARISPDRFTCWIAYDDAFMYLAADVTDADVRGTHADPHSEVFKDDAIEFFFEVDRARAKDRTPRTFEYGFSPAGGFSNVTGNGEGDGSRYPAYVWPPSFQSKIEFKIALKAGTTLNDGRDHDAGFIVEARVPWTEWHVRGSDMIGRSMGFNVVKICRPEQAPPSEAPLSLTPGVNFSNNHNPGLWRNLCLFNPSRLIVPSRNQVERARSASFKRDRKIVATHYFYWYRWPDHHFFDDAAWTDDGLQDHYARPESVSFDSPRWHLQQMRDVMAAGIDVILPVYWGAPDNYLSPASAFSVLGLPPLIEALDRIAADGAPHPLVGLFYDTSTLLTGVRNLGEPGRVLDLTTAHGKDVFYRTIRDFFAMIPPRYWAMIDGRPIVVLYGTFGAKHDQATLDAVYERFKREFGCRPYVVKNADWRFTCDADTSWGAALNGPQIVGADRPGAFVQIGPGYDDRAVPGRTTPVRPRDDGGFYQASWRKAIKSGRNVVLVETWNEMHEGTDVGESREYGRKYIQLTTRFARIFKQALALPPIDYEPSDIGGLRSNQGAEYAAAEAVMYEPARQAGVYAVADVEDGPCKIVEIAGAPALQSTKDEVSGLRYLYFRVADAYVFNTRGNVEIAVTYLDRGRGEFQLQYDSRDVDATLIGAYKEATPVTLTDTGAWKTAKWRPPLVRLANRQNGHADFRLAIGGRDLTIRKIVVKKLP